ncbi:proline-rich exported protein [Caballeronia fortuita]|uniref:Proline-rich exported protein n=1 Tax=Caballeronia fortuita TaxID=1777138 RepID=A0A158CJF5_9BURK|nr:DUF6600 domain-containing protein [Caballeronia fortuita]SAK82465.1 proline-rich exported protein [Caballeronia fortuita]
MKIKTVAAVALCVPLSTAGLTAFAQTGQGDPPGRIARLNYMAGTVTTEPAGASDWSYAQVNRPLTTGDQLWNDENARSELHIGSTAVRLGSSTALSVLALDDASAQLKIAQGTLSTRVRELPPGARYELDTPNTALAITTAGDVRVDVAPDGRATTVTVRSGGVTAYGDGASVQLAGGQQMTFEGTDLQQASANAAPEPDAFDQWAASRDAAEDRSVSARYVSRDIPGYQDLDANGTWRSDPSYGPVWVPSAVSADWAPYRQGHWAWQDPWGWTWIDDAPWGFAPYHYGRWAYVGSQWAWVPGPMAVSAPPAYSPALVAFVGDGGSDVDWNVALTVGGIAAAGVAWFPLGPGEAWRPHRDGWSSRYYERVNRNVYVHDTFVNYRAPRGLTAVPANLFVHGQPVGRQPYAVDPSRWRNPRFFAGAPGIAPTRDSYAPGARLAGYRPPQGGFARPVVATRPPVAPPVHDIRGPGARNDQVHLVATRGPALSVIAGGAPHVAVPTQPSPGLQSHGNGVPHPSMTQQFGGGDSRLAHGTPVKATPPTFAQPSPNSQSHGNGVPHPSMTQQFGGGDPRYSHRTPVQATQPTFAQPSPNSQPHGNGVPHPSMTQQFGGGDPRFAHGTPVQATQPFAQQAPHAPQQHQPAPDYYRQARVEQPHHEMPPPQPMHQGARQAPPPQMQHQEQHEQPHPQPQQAQQPQPQQQPQQHGGNERHRG